MKKEENKNIKIIDIVNKKEYETYMYKCLAPISGRPYSPRKEYISTTGKNLHKKLIFLNNKLVGQIEYCNLECSPYPIIGENIIILSCIWILKRGRGRGLGRALIKNMIESEKGMKGVATIALENHWSPWFRLEHIKYLGFKPIDTIKVKHIYKHPEKPFKIHLMWQKLEPNTTQPTWDKNKLLKGITYCMAHPLYSPKAYRDKNILIQI
jgi:GNAT superfamily N-acetyltransferase